MTDSSHRNALRPHVVLAATGVVLLLLSVLLCIRLTALRVDPRAILMVETPLLALVAWLALFSRFEKR